jgi:hypothetical protein
MWFKLLWLGPNTFWSLTTYPWSMHYVNLPEWPFLNEEMIFVVAELTKMTLAVHLHIPTYK